MQRSTGTRDREEATAICAEWARLTRLAARGELVESQARKVISDISERAGLGSLANHTVESWLQDWIEQKRDAKKAPNTVRRYENHVEAFCDFLGDEKDRMVGWVTPAKIQKFRQAELKAGKSVTSANHALKTLRMAFGVANSLGLILSNPAKAVEVLPTEKTHKKPFSRQQVKALLDEADDDWRGMILVAFHHGLRIEDCANLTWSNFDPEKRALSYRPSKTRNKYLTVPLHPDVLQLIAALPSVDHSDAPLFPSLHGRISRGRNGLSARFRDLMHKAHIVSDGEQEERKKGKGRRVFELSFHSLRATAATEGAEAGIDEHDRMKLVGHDNRAVHRNYTQKQLEKLRAEVEKVPSIL